MLQRPQHYTWLYCQLAVVKDVLCVLCTNAAPARVNIRIFCPMRFVQQHSYCPPAQQRSDSPSAADLLFAADFASHSRLILSGDDQQLPPVEVDIPAGDSRGLRTFHTRPKAALSEDAVVAAIASGDIMDTRSIDLHTAVFAQVLYWTFSSIRPHRHSSTVNMHHETYW